MTDRADKLPTKTEANPAGFHFLLLPLTLSHRTPDGHAERKRAKPTCLIFFSWKMESLFPPIHYRSRYLISFVFCTAEDKVFAHPKTAERTTSILCTLYTL